MDMLISEANAMSNETGVHLLYSTPSCYVRALHEEEGGGVWPTMTDKDFFPYISGAACVRTVHTTMAKEWQ